MGTRIAFYGKMCSGKTTCANYLVINSNFVKMALADKLKAIAYELYGVEGKDGASRALLQGLGDDLRKWDEDVFINAVLRKVAAIEALTKFPPKIVVDDVRFPNEAAGLLAAGFTLVGITANEDVRQERIKKLYPNMDASAMNHASEMGVNDIFKVFGWTTWIPSNIPSDLLALDKFL
jgi:hypothetical protein